MFKEVIFPKVFPKIESVLLVTAPAVVDVKDTLMVLQRSLCHTQCHSVTTGVTTMLSSIIVICLDYSHHKYRVASF